jgi:hypothetical protein
MGISGYHQLPVVRRVGKNFLIACHACVKAQLAKRLPFNANGFTVKHRSVFEQNECFFTGLVLAHSVLSVSAKLTQKKDKPSGLSFELLKYC